MTAASRDAARYAAAHAAEDERGLVGIALWMPPGAFPLTAVRKGRMVPALLRVAWLTPRALPAFARVGAALERSLPTGPLWYLQTLGVHPRARRSGVGTRLMREGLTRADRDRLPICLHTSDPANVPFYRRFGFEILDEDVRTGADGPRYIMMMRPPPDSPLAEVAQRLPRVR